MYSWSGYQSDKALGGESGEVLHRFCEGEVQ